MKIDLTQALPVLPLRQTVLFPRVSLPILVGREVSVEAVKLARHAHKNFVIAVSQKDDGPLTPQNFSRIGVLAELKSMEGSDQQGYYVLAEPALRVRLTDIQHSGSCWMATSEKLPDVHDVDASTEKALLHSLQQMATEVLELVSSDTSQLQQLLKSLDDLSYLTHICCTQLEMAVPEKQALLEMTSLKGRTLKLLEVLSQKKDELQVRSEIRDRLSHKIGKGQREAILREQLKTIREELGENEDPAVQQDTYRKKIDEAGMPEEVQKTALEELKRLEALGGNSPETHVIRNYLDLLCAMPWSHSADQNLESLDLLKARKILDQEHCGLEKIKQRILQHLAVMKLKGSVKGSILLFIGPPGVGKTSLGASIAKAMGRQFVRGSLGGVRDDAEIRGHRRTYIGAMPGRIIQGIKRAGENNPVFMLDEIDKLGRGFAGDPAAALLEVLDPEQNATFLDHYLDVPFDLSKVFFIATANSYDGIPGPLLDRMEVIDLSGYTLTEKTHIAKAHLIPKVLAEHGIAAGRLTISDEALSHIISSYTREAGVRELQRQIATLARASAQTVLQQEQEQKQEQAVPIEVGSLEELLGPERYYHDVAENAAPAGVVSGLAWTPQGGDILFIEGTSMPGRGQLTLTGQLGEVMKESAQIALSLVRSRLAGLLPSVDFEKRDLHVHVPAGAIPKDGPSAGVTMLTTIASVFLNQSVDPRLAMTGEITLRGAVLPVGGIKEKIIAAHRAGMERVLLARRNDKDLRDIPAEVRDQMKFEFVDSIEDVLRVALDVDPTRMQRAAG